VFLNKIARNNFKKSVFLPEKRIFLFCGKAAKYKVSLHSK